MTKSVLGFQCYFSLGRPKCHHYSFFFCGIFLFLVTTYTINRFFFLIEIFSLYGPKYRISYSTNLKVFFFFFVYDRDETKYSLLK